MTIRHHYPATGGNVDGHFKRLFPPWLDFCAVSVCSKSILTDIWTSKVSKTLWHLPSNGIYIYIHMMTFKCTTTAKPPPFFLSEISNKTTRLWCQFRDSTKVIGVARKPSHWAIGSSLFFFWGGGGKWFCEFWWLIFVGVALEKTWRNSICC